MFTTQITQLDCKQDDPSHIDCVQTVHYRHTKTEGVHTASVYGTLQMDEPTQQYTPFSQLTQAQVMQWCNFDSVAIEAALDAQLQEMKTPSVIGKPAPWGQS